MYAAVYTPGGAPPAALFQCASDFSPCVEQTAPDMVVISISGLTHLFGSFAGVVAAIARRAADLGLVVNVTAAANPDLAVHGARGFPGVTVLEPGMESGLPIALLDPPPWIAGTLALWGIRTFGEFATLPEDGVTERLGPEGAHLHKLARGAGDRPLVPPPALPVFEDSVELEDSLTLIEPLAFLLGRLIGSICARLESHGLATHELHLVLTLEESRTHECTLRLPYPMRDARTFLKLLTLDVEQHPPAGPVIAVALSAQPVNPRVVQHGLFIPLAPEPQKLELTLARITKLVGEGNAGSPELLDTHRPRAFRMGRFVVDTEERRRSRRNPSRRLALRVFRPALRARVQAPKGLPVRIEARAIRGTILESSGPWRTAGDWWRDDAWSRDEWDIALYDGSLYLLYRDRREEEWYLEGAYD